MDIHTGDRPDQNPANTVDEFFEKQIAFMRGCMDFKGKTVIEFGAQFGKHSARLIDAGAVHSTAIEGRVDNLDNFVKGYGGRIMSVLADVRAYRPFYHKDIGLVLGILYHLDRPALFLKAQLPYIDKGLFIWTHYTAKSGTELDGYKGVLWHDKGKSNSDALVPLEAFWFTKRELFRCLEDNGFKVRKHEEMKTPISPQYPAVMLYAERVC